MLLRRSGWSAAEIDITSFAAAAAYCDEEIAATDINGNPITLPRFQCNLLLQNRRSAGDVVRGIRNCARMYLDLRSGRSLQAKIENTIALESPSTGVVEQYRTLNGGWPSYEFGDGSNGFSGIMRKANGASSVVVTSRSIADTPNCMSVEFQDALNGYQQDSYEMVDPDDIALNGADDVCDVDGAGPSAVRSSIADSQIQPRQIDPWKYLYRVSDEHQDFGVSPGDLITVTYLKEGFIRQPFRVLRISPATNYRTRRSQRRFTTMLVRGHERASDVRRRTGRRTIRAWDCRIRYWAAWSTATEMTSSASSRRPPPTAMARWKPA
jgi:hypothetical protein